MTGSINNAGLPLPVHYLDDGYRADDQQRGVCPHSGTGDMAQGCPRGCEGAKEHYSNDGHPQCDDPTGTSVLGIMGRLDGGIGGLL